MGHKKLKLFQEFFMKSLNLSFIQSKKISEFSIVNDQLTRYFHCPKKPREIKFLVLHHTQANSAEEAIKLYGQFGVSAHFLIETNGEIFLLVEEENVAYHAGKSFWRGTEGLNSFSIGIEFLSPDPEKIGFSNAQIESGLNLCHYLIKKYPILPSNIVGHSDIAYTPALSSIESGLLNRKQDPSHLFPWKFFAENGVGIYPKFFLSKENKVLFNQGMQDERIKEIKRKLNQVGYKVNNFNNQFDVEMDNLALVFNRRFNPQRFSIDVNNFNLWYLSSQISLDCLIAIV